MIFEHFPGSAAQVSSNEKQLFPPMTRFVFPPLDTSVCCCCCPEAEQPRGENNCWGLWKIDSRFDLKCILYVVLVFSCTGVFNRRMGSIQLTPWTVILYYAFHYFTFLKIVLCIAYFLIVTISANHQRSKQSTNGFICWIAVRKKLHHGQ